MYVHGRVFLIAISLLTLGPACGNSSEIVSLSRKNDQNGSYLYGELNVGEVKAGDSVKAVFQLKNDSNDKVEFLRIKPSCKCVNIKIESGSLSPGELSNECSFSVKSPITRGRGIVIAELSIFGEESGISPPVAIVRVTADIRRPVFIPTFQANYSVRRSEPVKGEFIVHIDPAISLDDVVVYAQPKLLEVALTRSKQDDWKCTLEFRGDASELLTSRLVSVHIDYKQDGWNITDAQPLNFFDGDAIRVFPSQPLLVNGKVSFAVYASAGISSEKFSFSSKNGQNLAAKVETKSAKLSQVEIEISKDVDFREIVLLTGEYGEVVVPFEVSLESR